MPDDVEFGNNTLLIEIELPTLCRKTSKTGYSTSSR